MDDDLGTAQQILADRAQPLQERLLDSFDQWAGRYIGPLARDLPLAQTLISTSIGIKHQVDTRRAYRRRLQIAVTLLLR